MILTIIDTYNLQKQNQTLTPYGESLLLLLNEFQEGLNECKIIVENKNTNLWEFIDEAEDAKEWLTIVSEEYPNNFNANKALRISIELENRLLKSCGDAGFIQKIHRWIFDSSLGTIDQMRIELESRYNCEQIWITSENIKLDCMIVTNSNFQDSPTILLCNPNAGLYEFAYYQSEWLDFYNSLGITVFVWNYRGYGRSQGTPNPEVLKNDGKNIIEYLRKVKKIKILGVHGESLGGSIASHLARNCEIDFLFSDRSFARLNEVVEYSFGKWAKVILLLVSRWKVDSALDFLYVNCYKIISADPHDNMINDLASLKSGVAIKLIETRGLEIAEGINPVRLNMKKYFHILSSQDTFVMLQALCKIMEFVMKYIKSELDRNSGLVDITNTTSYHPVGGKNIEVLDEETINALLYRIFGVLDGIDAGGKCLSNVFMDADKMTSLKLWIMVLDIWGSFFPIESIDLNTTRARSLEKLKESIDELKQAFTDHEYSTNPIIVEICRETKFLEKSFAKILVYLKNQIPLAFKINEELSPGREELSTFRHHFEYDKAGYLIPLNCGHSGRYSNSELALLETHLTRIGFIK